jgi:hypothetical protein
LSDEPEAAWGLPLDRGVVAYVRCLQAAGVETFESCEGGEGHCYPEPTVPFHGGRHEGWKALTVVQEVGYRVLALRRIWPVKDGEPTGPYWEIVFRQQGPAESD